MLDTLTVLTYLISHEAGDSNHLHLQALFLEKQTPVSCVVQQAQSPQLRWQGVPPEASSLALIVKDTQPNKTTGQPNYYWVAYNLPIDEGGLPLGGSHFMNPNDQSVYYHSPWACNNPTPSVEVELFALDKRFSTIKKLTGSELEAKLTGHVLAKAIVVE